MRDRHRDRRGWAVRARGGHLRAACRARRARVRRRVCRQLDHALPDVRDLLFDGREVVVRRAAVRDDGREAVAARCARVLPRGGQVLRDSRCVSTSAVTRIDGRDGAFVVRTNRRGVEHATDARAVIVATGYWGSPNRFGVPGEDLPHVTHAYREGHYAFQQNAVVVGGGNSAAEAALDLWRAGARVTLVHFGPTFDKKIKPWVLPDFTNRVAEGSIAAIWNSRVAEIGPENVTLRSTDDAISAIPADHVFLMTGFAPSVRSAATGWRDDRSGDGHSRRTTRRRSRRTCPACSSLAS